MFQKARLKLTAWYLLIIMLISICFSVVIFRVISNEVDRFAQAQRLKFERQFRQGGFPTFQPIPFVDPDLIAETKKRFLLMLVGINGTILVFAGGLGYFLAGRTLKPIKEMVDEQNQFISDSSHELRTPLTALKSSMEVNLRDKQLTIKEARVLIRESIEDVNKLQRLSDQLLQLAQFQKPNGYDKFEQLSLLEIVQSAIKKVEPMAKQKNIEIKNEVQKIQITGNKDGLTDLLIILLDNAVKYTPEKKKIFISSHKTDGFYEIIVKDQGIGIDKKDITHIFDRFYRADSARTKSGAGGYGLGLSIAKKIVDLHHGTITVKSETKKGSTFTIRLPVGQKNQIALANKIRLPFSS